MPEEKNETKIIKEGIINKLVYIQNNLKAPKSQNNNFGNYKYRSNEDILEAVKPLLFATGVALIESDEIVEIGGRIYVKATASLIDMEDGSKFSNTAYAREEEAKKGMDGSQITGSSSSYARKYALNGLFAIDDTKDSDTTNLGNNTENQRADMITEEQIKEIKDLNVIIPNVLKRYKITDLKQLTQASAKFIIESKKKSIENGEIK